MDLAISTPEGPFESIVFLGDCSDWPAWYDDVCDIAQALNIWKYVDPDVQLDLCEPAKPSFPTRPILKYSVKREQFETDKAFELRVEQERQAHALTVREYDVRCEEYRLNVAHYLVELAEYNTCGDNLLKLYRIIYRSIPDKYRAYLRLDAARSPRAIILSLKSRIKPLPRKDQASVALRTFRSKLLNVQPGDDKEEFVDAVALAAVDLHRYMGDKFDEDTAVADLWQSLHVLHEGIAQSMSRREGKRTVLEIVEDFRQRLRRRGDRDFAPEPTDDGTIDDAAFSRPFARANHSHHWSSSGDDLAATPKPNGKKDSKGSSHEHPGAVGRPGNAASKTKEYPYETSSGASNKENKPSRTEDAVFPKKTADNPRPEKAKKPVPGRTSSPASRPDKHPHKANKKPDLSGLSKKVCPGCELTHLIRNDAWWENCYIYWRFAGLDMVPSHFFVPERKLDLVYSRLQDFPDEKARSSLWVSMNPVANAKSGASAGGNASSRHCTVGETDNAIHFGTLSTTAIGKSESKSESNTKSKGKGKSKTKSKQPSSVYEFQPQNETEEFNLW